MGSLRRDFLKKSMESINECEQSPSSSSISTNSPPLYASSRVSRRLQVAPKDYSPLDWLTFFDRQAFVNVGGDSFCVYIKGETGTVFYFLHGGGYSGLTWSCVAEELSKLVNCRIFAPDLRGHGATETSDDYSLSVEQQVNDIVAIHSLYFDNQNPPTFVIGHSMGGALAVHAALSGRIKSVVGVCVIDVVEGTALNALSMMSTFLNNRPKRFNSLETAIEWAVRSGTAKNVRSARVSMPSQVRKSDEHFVWRIDLNRTSQHWKGWFNGLSEYFLSCSAPKVLILAGTDRLDTNLTVGQMQGKFQTTILRKSGHAIQEDLPYELAVAIAKFAIRFRFCSPKDTLQ